MTIHGEAQKTVEYNSWRGMLQRCNNKNHKQYPVYGGRGIKVCKRWSESYENFLADMGRKPDGFVMYRINRDGNFEPRNCKWATPKEQANNRPHFKPKPPIKCAICGKIRKNAANGVCRKCFRGPVRKCVGCGEEKPHLAKGFCKTCYVYKGQTRIICKNCGKNNQRHAGHNLCQKCYRLIYRSSIIERIDKRRTIICSECGEEKELHARQMCCACYSRVGRPLRQCVKCGELRKIAGQGACSFCYKSPLKICRNCGELSTHYANGCCKNCYIPPERICAGCNKLKKITYNDESGCYCQNCYYHHFAPKKICVSCNNLRVISGGGLCGNCYARKRRKNAKERISSR